jgi:dihydropyrimidinase
VVALADPGDAAVDFAVSLVVTPFQEDAVAEIPAAVELGVPTFKAFMVYDFGLDDRRLFHALAMAGASGGMLEVHCENAVMLEELTARHLEAGETAPRFHATSRPPYVEAEATVRAIAYARAARAPLYVVHLSCDEALDAVRAGRAEGLPVFAETCPHYLTMDDSRYLLLPEEAARHHLAAPPRGGRARPALGGAGRRVAGARRHGPRPGPARHREAVLARVLRPHLQRRSGHRDALDARPLGGRRPWPDHHPAHGRPAGHDAC